METGRGPILPGVLSHALAAILLLPVLVVAQDRLEADAIRIGTLVLDGVEHPIRMFGQARESSVNLEDLARAVGGAWGRDPLSRSPLFTIGNNRVLFSTTDRRISVNGRRRRLSHPVQLRHGSVWVPLDFIEGHLARLIDVQVDFRSTAPRPLSGRDDPMPDSTGRASGSTAADRSSAPDRRRSEARERFNDPLPGWRETPSVVQFIVLDPGHGGDEEGARGPTGLLEKDVVLEVARRLRLHLQRRGYDVHLTRSRDVNVPLEERTAVANNRQADLFISLHANASTGRSARGAEIYYLSLDRADQAREETEPAGAYVSPRDRDDPLKMILWDMAQSTWLARSGRLAEIIQDDFNRVLDIPDRGVKQAPFRILVGATMPAVLVEIGFISNAEEEERMRDPDFLDIIVRSLTRSIDAYRSESRRQVSGSSDNRRGSRPRRRRP